MKNRQLGFAHLGLALVLPFAFIVAVGYYVYKNNSTKTSNSEIQSPEPTLTATIPTDLKTADEIRNIVLDKDPNANIGSIELEPEDNIFVYRVRMVDGSVLAYDAKTGKPLNLDDEKDGDTIEKKLPENLEVKITFEQARSIALGKYPNQLIEKIKLKVRHNNVIYRVYFEKGYQVDIDANTGDIVRANKENHDTKEQGSSHGTPSHESNSSDSQSTDDNGSNDSSGSDDSGDSGDNSGSNSGDSGDSGGH